MHTPSHTVYASIISHTLFINHKILINAWPSASCSVQCFLTAVAQLACGKAGIKLALQSCSIICCWLQQLDLVCRQWLSLACSCIWKSICSYLPAIYSFTDLYRILQLSILLDSMLLPSHDECKVPTHTICTFKLRCNRPSVHVIYTATITVSCKLENSLLLSFGTYEPPYNCPWL